MRKTLLLLALLPAAALANTQHRSKLSLALETGMTAGSLPKNKLGNLYGGDIRYDLKPRWAVAAHFQSRTYQNKDIGTEQSVIQPVTATLIYDLKEGTTLTPTPSSTWACPTTAGPWKP